MKGFIPVLVSQLVHSDGELTPEMVFKEAGIKPSEEAALAKKAKVQLRVSFAENVIALFVNDVRVKTDKEVALYIQHLKAAKNR